MYFKKTFVLLLCVMEIVYGEYGDWVSEWMSPVQNVFTDNQARRVNENDKYVNKTLDLDEPKTMTVKTVPSNLDKEPESQGNPAIMRTIDDASVSLKVKLESTLQTAQELVQTLKGQILALVAKENVLKDAIANGRYGVTTVTVQTLSSAARSYIVREGIWYLCNGMVQRPADIHPSSAGLFAGVFRSPRCIGQEVASDQDPCAFNSMIKYATVPQQRRPEYAEDSFLCLKSTFNSSLEQFMSVPRRIVNETCKNGVVRDINENIEQCGLRVMSEYTFYPHEPSAGGHLPLEYCTERDGSCKLIVAWHISNSSIENFEFLRNEYNFKKYFLMAEPRKHLI